MPEAELPGNQHLPEKNDPLSLKDQQLGHNQNLDKTKNTLASEVDDDWETVDFPNTISVDSIPVVEAAEGMPETLNLEPKNCQSKPQEDLQATGKIENFVSLNSEVRHTRELESGNIMEALHECNLELVNRVTELEAALEECEKTLENQERLLEERTQELASTQQQVTRLFYKLELCNQIIQRQEVLVESLTQKWEETQQQQAQMERECAFTQQSYNQQTYHLKELENSCRELRSRLYRQQRQTLQFKAALERCLEMPERMGVVNQTELKSTLAEKSSVITEEVKLGPKDQPLIGKNNFHGPINLQNQPLPLVNSQPVKPWTPPPKPTEKEEIITSKTEETIAKISFGKKINLPEGLEATTPEISSDQSSISEGLSADVIQEELSPALPSFARIAEVPTYDLPEDSESEDSELEEVILADIETTEYVVVENKLDKYQNQQQAEEKITVETNNLEILEYDISKSEQSKQINTTKTERISWNISTGKWNVSEYQVEERTEVEDPEEFAEVPETIEEYAQQTATKLDLPTWNPPIIDHVVPVSPEEKLAPSLAAIDLPTFPKIPIDDQPSAVGG